jgi:arylsulfatase
MTGLILAGGMLLTGLPADAAGPSGARPNIVLILADDLGWSDIGCYGSEIDTPNLDRLAKGGIRFTQFHNTSKCFPSRACLLTGLYAQQCGMDRSFGKLKNAVTLAEILRVAGYRTLMAGKHHGTENPFERGFDRYFGLRDGCCNYFNPGKQRPGEGKPAQKRTRTWCIDGKTFKPYTPPEKDFYTTDYFTKYALSYLSQYRNEKKPFFLYLAYTAPHDPLMAWPKDIAKYAGRYKAGYAAIRKARFERQRRSGLIDASFPLSGSTYGSWGSQQDEARKMAVYAAMIDRMDQNIGKVLDAIQAMGKEKNTLVFFCSDNGASGEVVKIGGPGEIGEMTRWSSLGGKWMNVCNTPFRFGKNSSFEGGVCTPLIASWPAGIAKPGRVSHAPGHFIDFMPTLMDVAGAPYPKTFGGRKITPFEGESLVPVFKGGALARTKPLFFQWSSGKAVREGRWKLVSRKKGTWELYDMEKDKTETRDLSGQQGDVVKRLAQRYDDWYARCKAGTK